MLKYPNEGRCNGGDPFLVGTGLIVANACVVQTGVQDLVQQNLALLVSLQARSHPDNHVIEVGRAKCIRQLFSPHALDFVVVLTDADARWELNGAACWPRTNALPLTGRLLYRLS